MRRFQDLAPGRSLVLVAAPLLLVDTFLPWQTVSVDGFSYSWNAWHGDKGVLLGVIAGVLFAWAVGLAFGPTLPDGVPVPMITVSLSVLLVTFAAVKNIKDVNSAWASYLGVVLAVLAVTGAWLAYCEASGAPSAAPAVDAT